MFSGHTHGGIFGVPHSWSLLSLCGLADNGLWKRGNTMVFIHRGQGSRLVLGNLLGHLGIVCEKSVLSLRF